MSGALLEVENLTVTFPTEEGPVTAVDDLSFTIGRGETWSSSANRAPANRSRALP